MNISIYKDQTTIFQLFQRTETYFSEKILGHCHQTSNKYSLGVILVVPIYIACFFYSSTSVPEALLWCHLVYNICMSHMQYVASHIVQELCVKELQDFSS